MTDTTEMLGDAMIDPVTGEIIDQKDLAERLLAQAKEQGVSLVGPGGLLNQLTKSVLESALNAELTNQVTNTVQMVRDLQGQMSQMMQLNQLLLEKLGMSSGAPASASAESPAAISAPPAG